MPSVPIRINATTYRNVRFGISQSGADGFVKGEPNEGLRVEKDECFSWLNLTSQEGTRTLEPTVELIEFDTELDECVKSSLGPSDCISGPGPKCGFFKIRENRAGVLVHVEGVEPWEPDKDYPKHRGFEWFKADRITLPEDPVRAGLLRRVKCPRPSFAATTSDETSVGGSGESGASTGIQVTGSEASTDSVANASG